MWQPIWNWYHHEKITQRKDNCLEKEKDNLNNKSSVVRLKNDKKKEEKIHDKANAVKFNLEKKSITPDGCEAVVDVYNQRMNNWAANLPVRRKRNGEFHE